MQIKGGKPSTRKRRIPKASVLLVFGLPVLLVAAYLIEGLGNPKLFSKNYLKAEYGPIILWPWERGLGAFGNENLLTASAKAIPNLLSSATSDEEIPDLVLDVRFREMRDIYQQRDEALMRGMIVQTEDSFVKAKIRTRDGSIPIKMRLKGDFTDHLRGDKWSFRIHVRKGETYLGMRRFSVQNPVVRGYHSENLYFEALKDYNVLTPRYLYVNTTVNGEDVGIMALEEHFSKELLESQSRREGAIVRYDETNVFRAKDGPNWTGFEGVHDDFRNAATDVFQGGQIAKNPTLSAQADVAMGMLRAFGEGKVAASEIFDVDTMGAYLAVSELMGAFHATRWHNQRFYMNPITLKMEPIAYDASLKQRESGDTYISAKEPIVHQMLQDPKIFARYKEVLNDLVQRVESGELIEKLRAEEERLLSILHAEYIYLSKYPLEEVEHRADVLAKLSDEELLAANYPKGQPEHQARFYRDAIRAYRVEEDGKIWLDVVAATAYDASVEAIELGETRIVLPEFPLELPGRGLDEVSEFVRIALPVDLVDQSFVVVGKHNDRNYGVEILDQAAVVPVHPIPSSDISDVLARAGYLSLAADAENTIVAAAGDWLVSGIIALPEGYTLRVGPGTTFRFAEDAMMIVRGSVFFDGTEEQPIRMLAQDGVESWKGFVAFAAPESATERSRWSNVQVQDTRGVQIDFWKLMGGTNFYRNDLDITNVSIKHHKGEDGLNIISSDFLTENLIIIDTLSDGFDCDFCTGTVNGGLFETIGTAGGGDAIDVSTSRLTVNGTRFVNVDDKAVSVGEASQMIANGLQIESCGTGAAAKDGSRLTISESTIQNSRISALMSYIKKPEFGVAEVIASKMNLKGNRATAVVQIGSRVVIDGVEQQAEDIDVDELYDTVMRPGLRRPKPEVKQ